MAWKDRLQDASFRGVPFKVEDEGSPVGRRVETHEYPNRDKPYTEDLGKVTSRPTITAYVVGDDCFDQRDRLIEALNKPGPGTLIHPVYGEMNVCVDGEIHVSTTKTEGRVVRFDLRFVEAGELSYPTAGAATAQILTSSCSALDDCISDGFGAFGMDGMPDFIQGGVVERAGGMLGYVSDAMKMVDSSVSDAARLLQGDISVLLPPPSSGKGFIDALQKMWRTGNRLYGNTGDIIRMVKTLSGISMGKDLAPRGVWKTESQSTRWQTEQGNTVAGAIRTTALSEAAYAVSTLPAPVASSPGGVSGQTPAVMANVSHPALSNASQNTPKPDTPSWEELTAVRDTLNVAIDREMSRTNDDRVFIALRRLKADLNTDLIRRLRQSDKTVTVIPSGTGPALVMAAYAYDDANRADEIVQRNRIAHPGFLPRRPLRLTTRQLAWRIDPVTDREI
ncbi:DNA circularization N-terminal domain-containing protein [Kluyvera cryocrescens]|uniref:DNA circularization protein n=1 Tax=Kluyvera cryocrescens TaxID=580 RepID=UPI002DBF6053|nr:DNA circularization N-terminal domain-containing protein [Kluyvera cryocrescens]MEB7559184.1 DNA circularization N-terminal domain-containing protein [Kluyvera cryocrescens]